jgi:hypothetical protein
MPQSSYINKLKTMDNMQPNSYNENHEFPCLGIHRNIPLDLLSEFRGAINLLIDLLSFQSAYHSVMFVGKSIFVLVQRMLDILWIQAGCNEFSKYC